MQALRGAPSYCSPGPPKVISPPLPGHEGRSWQTPRSIAGDWSRGLTEILRMTHHLHPPHPRTTTASQAADRTAGARSTPNPRDVSKRARAFQKEFRVATPKERYGSNQVRGHKLLRGCGKTCHQRPSRLGGVTNNYSDDEAFVWPLWP